MRVRYKNTIVLVKSLTQVEHAVLIDTLVDKRPEAGYSKIRRFEVVLADEEQAGTFMNEMLITGYKDLSSYSVNCSYRREGT